MKKINAFSLIELLISLIIISFILSAFTPIITKRLKSNKLSLSNKSVTTDCTKFDNENRCLMCTQENCTLCSTQMDTLEGYYVDANQSCDLKACESKFQNCISCNKDFCTKCKTGYFLKDNSCVSCPNGCIECVSQNECTKCEAGYLISKKICKKMTDAPCLNIGSICAAKFNAGDANGLSIPSGVSCWQGTTATGYDTNNGGYSGCCRTSCTYASAKAICEYHGWRLPTADELSTWGAYSIGKGAAGLQLCDDDPGYNSAWCNWSTYCTGAWDGIRNTKGYCNPTNTWSSTLDTRYTNITVYSTYSLGRGVWFKDPMPPTTGSGVRCVRDL